MQNLTLTDIEYVLKEVQKCHFNLEALST